MKLQPVNQNNTLDNHHAYAVGMSSCGKTSAAKKLFVKATDQVVIFDPLNDYQGKLMGRAVRSYSNLRDFAIAVIAWGVGDGKHAKPIKVICEEVAEDSHTTGKATGYHGKLLRLGRKYNIHTINMFQRGQEVSKTIIDNCQYVCVMMQKADDSAHYIQRKTGIPASEIIPLVKLEYILQDGKAWEKGVIRW